MAFRIEIETDTEAFTAGTNEATSEIVRILRKTADNIEKGIVASNIWDKDKRCVGSYEWEQDSH